MGEIGDAKGRRDHVRTQDSHRFEACLPLLTFVLTCIETSFLNVACAATPFWRGSERHAVLTLRPPVRRARADSPSDSGLFWRKRTPRALADCHGPAA